MYKRKKMEHGLQGQILIFIEFECYFREIACMCSF